MLFVGGRCFDGDGRIGQFSDEAHPVSPLSLDIAMGFFFSQPLPK